MYCGYLQHSYMHFCHLGHEHVNAGYDYLTVLSCSTLASHIATIKVSELINRYSNVTDTRTIQIN